MFKRISIVFLCLILCFCVGCKEETKPLNVDSGDEPLISETESVVDTDSKTEYAVNPLTGVANLAIGKELNRPVAITINNIIFAQSVQTGIGKADIVYETEVEGGITRLVAVYQDVSKVLRVGTIRSARYAFIEIAKGHNAVYVHHGADGTHAKPHLKDVDPLVVDENNAGVRSPNGLSSEHTLYAYGDSLWNKITQKIKNTKVAKVTPWQNFTSEDTVLTFASQAKKITVPFSASYKTVMKYDEKTGKYNRYINNSANIDYSTGENVSFKNVFVLNTTIRTYPNCNDGKQHKEVMLNSGKGYYFVNGTYTPILWSKGAASNPFKFTLTDGTPLTVSPGNSWVCISDAKRSQPSVE